KVTNIDLYALPAFYTGVAASAATITEARAAVLRRGNINHQLGTDSTDIDALYQKLGTTNDLWYDDLNVDGLVTQADMDTLIHTIFQSQYGDANLDGSVDTIDFNILAANFSDNSAPGWGAADFNGDGSVDTTDFNLLASNFGFHFSADMLASSTIG